MAILQNARPSSSHASLILFIYLFGYADLCCCAWALSSYRKWEYPLDEVCGLLVVVASFVAEHGL